MNTIYDLVEEPKNEIYRRLILFSLKFCDKFQFVVPHHINQNKSVQDIIKKFKKFQISKTEKSEWPGTKLFRGTATIYQYRLNKETITLLINSASGLYSWVQPDYPEDLCLLRPDGTPWLVTISYERDGYFELELKEQRELQDSIPELLLSIHTFNKVD